MEYAIKTVYLDMDGVLANFEKRWLELFGSPPSEARATKRFDQRWYDFIESAQFSTLELFPGANELVAYLRQNPNITVEILSSSGGEKTHSQVEPQKIAWLKAHGFDFKPNIVPGKSKKKFYANPNTILIDDTESVILDFVENNGNAILHTDAQLTIQSLKSYGV